LSSTALPLFRQSAAICTQGVRPRLEDHADDTQRAGHPTQDEGLRRARSPASRVRADRAARVAVRRPAISSASFAASSFKRCSRLGWRRPAATSIAAAARSAAFASAIASRCSVSARVMASSAASRCSALAPGEPGGRGARGGRLGADAARSGQALVRPERRSRRAPSRGAAAGSSAMLSRVTSAS
jgi:hypothetical protein